MHLKTLKPTLFKLHRWIGIGLAPLFLLIALSGGILAFKPMQPATQHIAADGSSPSQLIHLLQQLDPLGREIDGLTVDAASDQVTLRSQNPDLQGQYQLGSTARLQEPTQMKSFDLFEFAEYLHKELLFGADVLIQIASYLMLLIIVIAPLIAWPRLRNNLMGWHRGVGWVLFPVILLPPLTGVLMSLHLGMPELPRMSKPGLSLSLEQGLQIAQRELGLERISMARRFRGGSVMLGTPEKAGGKHVIVTDQEVVTIDPGSNLVKRIHEGTWAGTWSGLFNLLGAVALSLLSLSGFVSWQRKRQRHRSRERECEEDAAAW
jgi:sulfite reductase (NADPH) flavoprotein alpha-component